jgi:hypothetical protein
MINYNGQILNYNSQVGQDKFVLSVLKNKKNGYFIEIGSNDPKLINNTFILEKDFNWSGIMVEYDGKWLQSYKDTRPNSIHVIDDATKIDYKTLFVNNKVPHNIDYLQIDLDVCNRSTLDTLELFNNTIFDNYKFATITFEHDIYSGDHFNTRQTSRNIFLKRGYILVFPDVKNGSNAFEDWYVHPDLVDMNYINKVKTNESLEFNQIMSILN